MGRHRLVFKCGGSISRTIRGGIADEAEKPSNGGQVSVSTGILQLLVFGILKVLLMKKNKNIFGKQMATS